MDYQLLLTAPGGGKVRDISALAVTTSWSGSVDQVSREVSATLAVPRDGSVELPELTEGAALTLRSGEESLFTGQLLSVTTSSQDSLVDLSALDNGRFLVGNQGFYKFTSAAPETALATLARDFGIPVASLAATGVRVSRKFAGVALDRIARTLYALAGEKTGRRYLVRFTGEGKLEVAARPERPAFAISSTMSVVNTWDITGLANSVAIRSETGELIRRLDDAASVALNGRLEQVLTQSDGEDLSHEARAILTDNGLQQRLTVETLGDIRLRAGEAVELRDTGSGVSGLFWIDEDTHTWKKGQHFTRLTLNFRNLLDNSSAGSVIT